MRDADIEAIRMLRERDAAASRAGDFRTLRTIMSDDAVVIAPGAAPQAGKASLDASFERMAAAPRTHEILDYRFDLCDPEFAGDLAIEYGTISGTSRALPDGAATPSRYNVLRVLRKEADGQWRVYRTIWTPGA